MNYAIILAGGIGKRMGQMIPKQFLNIGDKPILIHTVDAFYRNDKVDVIVIVCVEDWIEKATELLEYYYPGDQKIKVVCGGENRVESVMRGCSYIIENYITNDDDIVLTHDSVRPFVNDDIINNNICQCKIYGATTTAVKTIDTILLSDDGDMVDSVPNRETMYNVQTPQTFKLNELQKTLKRVVNQNSFTDLCGVYRKFGKVVHIIEGNYNNYKITTIKDLEDANNLLN